MLSIASVTGSFYDNYWIKRHIIFIDPLCRILIQLHVRKFIYTMITNDLYPEISYS